HTEAGVAPQFPHNPATGLETLAVIARQLDECARVRRQEPLHIAMNCGLLDALPKMIGEAEGNEGIGITLGQGCSPDHFHQPAKAGLIEWQRWRNRVRHRITPSGRRKDESSRGEGFDRRRVSVAWPRSCRG